MGVIGLLAVVLLTGVLTTYAHENVWVDDLWQTHEAPANLTIYQGVVKRGLGGSSEADETLILTAGDLYLTKDMYDRVYGAKRSDGLSKRKAVKDESTRWPGAEMPYTIAPNEFNDWHKYGISRAMTQWEKYTCFRFTRKTRKTKFWTRLQNGYGGCNSLLGFNRLSPQPVNLQNPGCRYKGLYLHEIGHAMGLIHEHQRPDRDNWIWINFGNVNPALTSAFTVMPQEEVDTMGIPYEYSSVMHYGVTAFSYDGKAQTITAKYPEREGEIGTVAFKELSYGDVAIVNKMYKCAAHCHDKNKCGSEGHLDENCNCNCKDGSSDCDTTKKPGDTNCKNTMNSWRCSIWANQGECERNSHYMKQACAKACGFCGPEPTNPSSCKDMYKNNKCEVWAERGDCVTNYGWMKRNCPKACKVCSEAEARPAVSCENKYKSANNMCDIKASYGDCKIDPVGMFRNCRKSCRWCDRQMIDVLGDIRISKWVKDKPVRCRDKETHCPDWAAAGHCDSNRGYMMEDCAKSCDTCRDGSCRNMLLDQECNEKMSHGACVTDIYFMTNNCALSCRLGACAGVGNITTTERPRPTQPTTTAEPQDPNCYDQSGNASCESKIGASYNFCNSEPGAMECKKSCHYCGCNESYDDCSVWADNGDCKRNPSFMFRNCQKSCKLC